MRDSERHVKETGRTSERDCKRDWERDCERDCKKGSERYVRETCKK